MLKILIVDDDIQIRESFNNFFRELEYEVFLAEDSLHALNIVEREHPEIMIVDFDLPDMNGIELIKNTIKTDQLTKFIMISGKIENQHIIKQAEDLGVIEFIPKPVSIRYIRDHTFPKIQRYQFLLEKKMRSRLIGIEIKSLQIATNALESKDKYTDGHSKRVMSFCVNTLKYLPQDIKDTLNPTDVTRAGILHDIGKIGIPEIVLNKEGKLTDEEFAIIKKHPVESVKILSPLVDDMPVVINAIRHHHERYGGGGYPDGLKGEGIPVISRLMAVADTYDAMTSDRAYRKKLDKKIAVAELIKCKNTQFDPVMVDAFLKFLEGEEV